MKILKMRNGIALMAVLVIMLLTSLFIPVMFNLSTTSIKIAITGTDRQRSSYLARTVCEMSVAAFKDFDSEPYTKIDPADTEARNNYTDITAEEKARLDPIIAEYAKLKNKQKDFINTERIYMFSTTKKGSEYVKVTTRDGVEIENKVSKKTYDELLLAWEAMKENGEDPGYTLKEYPDREVEEIVYATASSTDYETYKNNDSYELVGDGQCQITYDDSTHYYVTDNVSQAVEEVDKERYEQKLADLENALKNNQPISYSVSKKENKNVTFTSTATVKGMVTKRSCVLVLQTYPGKEDWLVLGIGDENGNRVGSGGNQVFVDPKKASARIPIEYDQAIDSSYIKQTLLVYSAVGNMLIQPAELIDKNTPKKDGNGNIIKDAEGNIVYEEASTGVNNSEFVLGVQPGLNTTPNDDPTYKIIDGVNYNTSKEIAQMNNFVAFTSTNAIQVDMPVNLLVNPCRANRLGDNITAKNGSLFKVMMFQAPTIQFNRRVDTMMSFYVPTNNSNARRMSSIVLMAPEDTPYNYWNEDRKKVVKAGMVYFQEDCYLWIIPYGEDGSSSSWAGFLSETVYERDSDFTKVKIASAGDVYQFNADVTVKGKDGKDERVGVSLTGYYLETEYIPKMEEYEDGNWWQIWSNTKTAIFANYMQGAFGGREDPTYVPDDFQYYGNMKADPIEVPEVDDYFTIWTD
ncbi:MAG: hypothetical protein E7556_06950 [Ruminococcaceae bacterium]|nr:hypothetical protein [Oscillospiraceae bacterium]